MLLKNRQGRIQGCEPWSGPLTPGKLLVLISVLGNFLVYGFWTTLPPPPINFVHATHILHMNKVGHVAAAPGPLACPSRGARPPSMS